MYCLKNVNVFKNGGFTRGEAPLPSALTSDFSSAENLYVLPGFADVHVHLREPGFSYKETIRTGTLAAARGGCTHLCAMPNVDPPPDCPAALSPQLERIRSDALVRVTPYGTLTRGRAGTELSDMEALAPFVCGFSDDGSGLASTSLMRRAMEQARGLGRVIAAHCEDLTAPPEEREWRQLGRDLQLVSETRCAYHACHLSRRSSLELIRAAKADGLDVTCETAPHYLLLDDTMTGDHGRFRMNPPIGSPEDRAALLAAVADGTIDLIATDHAPHSAQEKSLGFEKSLCGVVGLDCAFPALYTGLVETGAITLPRLVELLALAPRRRFGLPLSPGDFSVWDLGAKYKIDPGEFRSMGRSTPFEGMEVHGRCLMTVMDGRVIWEEKENA